jgi:hypothetical protein
MHGSLPLEGKQGGLPTTRPGSNKLTELIFVASFPIFSRLVSSPPRFLHGQRESEEPLLPGGNSNPPASDFLIIHQQSNINFDTVILKFLWKKPT